MATSARRIATGQIAQMEGRRPRRRLNRLVWAGSAMLVVLIAIAILALWSRRRIR